MSEVTHPSHYNQGKIEVIEFLEDQGLDFHLANAVKYICRAGKKLPEKACPEVIQELFAKDLSKAIWYLTRRLELLKSEPRRPNDMNPRAEEPAKKPPETTKPALRKFVCGYCFAEMTEMESRSHSKHCKGNGSPA